MFGRFIAVGLCLYVVITMPWLAFIALCAYGIFKLLGVIPWYGWLAILAILFDQVV